MKNNTTTTAAKLLEIAKRHSIVVRERGDLEGRGNDSEDFLDISVVGLAAMLEDAYLLGCEDGKQSVQDGHWFLRPDGSILTGNKAVDRNDPEAAHTAVELSVPTTFGWKAKALMRYLEDTAFIFAYKGRLVLTDESCELTEAGNGSREAPRGGPRADFGSWAEMERWLEDQYDGLQADGLM